MFRSPLFTWPPQADHDPEGTPGSQTSSRFAAFRLPRTIFHSSSIYSQSPSLGNENPFNALSPVSWQRRPLSNPNTLPDFHQVPHESGESGSALHAQDFTGSCMSSITSVREPQEPQRAYNRYPVDSPWSSQQGSRREPQAQELTEEATERRHRRKHRGKKHSRRNKQFVRKRNGHGSSIVSKSAHVTAARRKMLACVISGIFLITILAIYLAIALTNRSLGQEVHIIFIMILLAITVFFCHSLVRLCMLLLNAPRRQRRQRRRPHMSSTASPDSFQPSYPIRVHLACDEEAGNNTEATDFNPAETPDSEREILPTPPPPAYGLWRNSVRANPDLLYWQRAQHQYPSPISTLAHSHHPFTIGSPTPSPTHANTHAVNEPHPRPPSYISEDGVSYIIEATPRNTLHHGNHSRVSDIHPAWRPGHTASETSVNAWPT